MMSATPCDASQSRAPRMSSGRSPTITVVSWSTPSSVRRSASHGPLRVAHAPVEHLGAGDDDPCAWNVVHGLQTGRWEGPSPVILPPRLIAYPTGPSDGGIGRVRPLTRSRA